MIEQFGEAVRLFAQGRPTSFVHRYLEQRYGAAAVSLKTTQRWRRDWEQRVAPSELDPWSPLDDDLEDGRLALEAFAAVAERDGEMPPPLTGLVRRVAAVRRLRPDLPPALAYDLAFAHLALGDEATAGALFGEPLDAAVTRFLALAPWRGEDAAARYVALCRAAGAARRFDVSFGLADQPQRLVLVPLDQPDDAALDAEERPAPVRRHPIVLPGRRRILPDR
jgi:hypothetical protein